MTKWLLRLLLWVLGSAASAGLVLLDIRDLTGSFPEVTIGYLVFMIPGFLVAVAISILIGE